MFLLNLICRLQADVYKITGQTKRDHIPLPFVPGNEGAHEFCCSVCGCQMPPHGAGCTPDKMMLVTVQVSGSLRPMARAHLAFRSVGRAHSHRIRLRSWAHESLVPLILGTSGSIIA